MDEPGAAQVLVGLEHTDGLVREFTGQVIGGIDARDSCSNDHNINVCWQRHVDSILVHPVHPGSLDDTVTQLLG